MSKVIKKYDMYYRCLFLEKLEKHKDEKILKREQKTKLLNEQKYNNKKKKIEKNIELYDLKIPIF